MKYNNTLGGPGSLRKIPVNLDLFHSVLRCLLSGQSSRQRHAGSWASPATCSAAPAISLDSLTCFPWILSAEAAVRRKHNWKPKSCMQEPSLKSVDENWGGSLKSKLLSEAINPNCSEVYRSSMFEAQTLY